MSYGVPEHAHGQREVDPSNLPYLMHNVRPKIPTSALAHALRPNPSHPMAVCAPRGERCAYMAVSHGWCYGGGGDHVQREMPRMIFFAHRLLALTILTLSWGSWSAAE